MDTSHIDLSFNVAQLLKEPVGAIRKLDFGTDLLVLSDRSIDPEDPTLIDARDVTGQAKVTRLSQDLLVQGNVTANVRLTCSRCLEEFMLPVQGTLEEKYQPSVDVVTGRPVQRALDEEDDSAFSINAAHEIDLAEPVRQALLVALPIMPLHSPDCAGLCPVCGANLNEGPHTHESDDVDNRWAGLRELRLDDFPADNGQNRE